MLLHEYPRPDRDNGRGMHWSASPYHPTELDDWIARLKDLHIRWLKVLDDGGGSSLRLCERLLSEGIMPVVRLYRLQPNPGHIGGREERTLSDLAKAGVRYIETNNEPDLQVEWSIPRPLAWVDIVADNWLHDARKCLDAGALPAVPALSVGTRDDLIGAIVARGGRELLEAGAWVAIHNYTINHPLDYPDDDVNQRGQALTPDAYKADGGWAWDNVPLDTINAWRWQDKNPGNTIQDDTACFRSFEYTNSLVIRALGRPLPMIATEGGVVVGWREDRRYPRITPAMHEQMTVAMFSFMQSDAPSYFFAVCPWLIANYALGHFSPGWESQAWYTNWWDAQFGLNGKLPAVDAVAALPSVSRLEKEGPQHSVIRGRIDAMRGVSSMRLVLRGDGFSAAAATDNTGDFSFTGLAAGMYTLYAGGLIQAGLQLDGTNTIDLPGLRPPLPSAPDMQWDARLTDMRASVIPAEAAAGTPIWRLVSAGMLDQTQAGVGGAVYYDVCDELGRPLAGQEVILAWPTGMGRKATEKREAPSHGAEFPIAEPYDPSSTAGPYSAWVDGLPCDHVIGIGLPNRQVVGFALRFQRGPAPGASGSSIQGAIGGDAAGRSVTLRLPSGAQRTTSADARGRFAYDALPPGAYELEIAGIGAAAAITLDGANTVAFEYAPPSAESTLRGSVIGGGAGIDVVLASSSGEQRRTTTGSDGRYEFRFLAAGVYRLTVAGHSITGLHLDGRNTLDAPAIDIRPRLSVISGHVLYTGGIPVAGCELTLTGPAGARENAASDAAGKYSFAGLGAGNYTVTAGDEKRTVTLDGLGSQTLDFELPLVKPLELVVLFGPPAAAGTRANLRLAQRYLRTFRPTVSFRLEEAERARQVVIVGDMQAVSAGDEERLRRSGSSVARIGGNPYAVEDGLARLVSGGSAMPRAGSAAAPHRRRPDDR